MIRFALGMAAALALAALPCAAQVYKWIDKDGKVQYSDSPPPEGAKSPGAVKVDAPPPSPAAEKPKGPSWQEKELDFKKRRIEAERKEAQEKQQHENDRIRCGNARGRLKFLQRNERIFDTNEQGERGRQWTDKERNDDLARTNDAIERYCHNN